MRPWQLFIVLVLLIQFSKENAATQDEVEYYKNPVIGENCPDPGALRVEDFGGGFVVVCSSNYARGPQQDPAFPIYFSTDLVNWRLIGHVFPAGGWPSWGQGDAWAPEVHRVGDAYHVYYTMRAKASGELCLGVATSEKGPLGPYKDLGRPQLQRSHITGGGVIDSTYYKDPVTGKQYLSWKYNKAFCSPYIEAKELESNGLDLKNGSDFVNILESSNLIHNDLFCIEAPWFHFRNGYHYLFFSANWYDSPDYFTGVARSSSGFLGPYERMKGDFLAVDRLKMAGFNGSRGMLQQKSSRNNNVDENSHETATDEEDQAIIFPDRDPAEGLLLGPGHGSMVTDDAGDDWFVYHAWIGPASNIEIDPPGRVICIDKIVWTEDDWPVIGVPSSNDLVAAPTLLTSNHTNKFDRLFPPINKTSEIKPSYKGLSKTLKTFIKFRNDFCWMMELLTSKNLSPNIDEL